MNFAGKTIVIGICGGIAAYRACDLIRELYRLGARQVLCLLSEEAKAFITPLTLASLSRHPVYVDHLAIEANGQPTHIHLAQQADAMLILPASANTLAKLAHGLADNLLTTTFLCFGELPVVIAPAMNPRMWHHPLTQRNVETLAALPNTHFVQPTSGELACGEVGEGHLASQKMILLQLYRAICLHQEGVLKGRQALKGLRALVSAGGTQAMIDPVRFITNRSSGKMGFALADELFAQGAEVTVVSTIPVADKPYPVIITPTAEAMQVTLEDLFPTTDLLIMAAAVSDFRVTSPTPNKLHRLEKQAFSLSLSPEVDILASLGERKRSDQFLVGFAAETETLAEKAQAKLRRKHLDMIVANDVSRKDIGFETDHNEVTLFLADGSSVFLERAPKHEIARALLAVVAQQLQPAFPLPELDIQRDGHWAVV